MYKKKLNFNKWDIASAAKTKIPFSRPCPILKTVCFWEFIWPKADLWQTKMSIFIPILADLWFNTWNVYDLYCSLRYVLGGYKLTYIPYKVIKLKLLQTRSIRYNLRQYHSILTRSQLIFSFGRLQLPMADLCEKNANSFIPLPVEALGGYHKKALEQIRKLKRVNILYFLI